MNRRISVLAAAFACLLATGATSLGAQGLARADRERSVSPSANVLAGALDADGPEQQADSLYRAARRALDGGDYRRAASLYAQVAERFAKTGVAADALYWNAYALYRTGNGRDLSAALTSLESLGRRYPESSANRGDATSLRMRICGELAQRGDEKCAQEVSAAASASASSATTARQGTSCPKADDDNDPRVMALNALLQMNSEQALPVLEHVLARRDACSEVLRTKAVFLVAQHRSDRTADILLNAAKNDPSQEVREQAIFWLGNVRDPRVLGILAEIANGNGDEAMKEKAVFSIGQVRGDSAAGVLRDIALRDATPKEVRLQAIFQLGQRRNDKSAEFLKSLYGRVQDADLKDKVLFSISQLRSPEVGKWLLDIAQNEKEDMNARKQALFYAGQTRNLSLDDLGAVYNRVKDREMKEQVIFVYSQRRDSAAVDKLMDIAKGDSDRDLRAKAIFWLGQSHDPRVAKFLEELINK